MLEGDDAVEEGVSGQKRRDLADGCRRARGEIYQSRGCRRIITGVRPQIA
jgi:hypothetical protein